MRVTRRSAVSRPKAPQKPELAPAELIATVDYALAATTDLERKCSQVFELLRPQLYAFARRYLDPDAAEDAVQDTMISCWRRRHQVFVPGRTTSFFFRVLKNRIGTLRLRERRRLVRMDKYRYHLQTFYEPVDPVDKALEDGELATILERTLAKMPLRCRTVWLLVRENGMPYREAATTMGLALPTVKGHMTRAQTLLREEFFQAGYRESPKLLTAKSRAGGGPR
jgi:RNA polymerase sigma-70 factor (ECF subfamily)